MLLHLDSRRGKQTADWLIDKISETTIPIIFTTTGKYEEGVNEGVRPTLQSAPARVVGGYLFRP